jgi:hypothetical protein
MTLSHRTATQLDRLPVFTPHQFIMLKSLHRRFWRRLDRFLEGRLAGRNPSGKTLAEHAYRTEFHRSGKLIATSRAGEFASVIIALAALQPQPEPKATPRSTEWCEADRHSALHTVVPLHKTNALYYRVKSRFGIKFLPFAS